MAIAAKFIAAGSALTVLRADSHTRRQLSLALTGCSSPSPRWPSSERTPHFFIRASSRLPARQAQAFSWSCCCLVVPKLKAEVAVIGAAHGSLPHPAWCSWEPSSRLSCFSPPASGRRSLPRPGPGFVFLFLVFASKKKKWVSKNERQTFLRHAQNLPFFFFLFNF